MKRIPSFCLTGIFTLFISTFSWAQLPLAGLQYRSVGPERGGRVTAVAGTAAEPGTFYLGATGAGVWKTTDYGTRWTNVSDGYFATPSIGAIAVADEDPQLIYVGTGSDGLRSNVIVGKGMYKSTNGGKSWQPAGLDQVGQIGAVVIHPTDTARVFVAAIGQPFQANPERGIYRTTDGGKHWQQVLFLSEEVGFADLEMVPGSPDILYAAAWKAERKPWTIISGGQPAEGGVFKSTDGGNTWQKMTTGLPTGLIGKIDLAVCAADPQVVYALVEAPGKAGGLYKSVDQGNSFQQMSDNDGIRSRPFYYTNVEVDPTNPAVVYAMATGYFKSTDSGEHWTRMRPPHGDNHDMWINPTNPDLFIQANDGGANVTHNGGQTWSTQFNQNTAEIYQVELDDQYPYWLYGGQQDNYTTIAVPSLAPSALQAAGIGWIINTGGCETGPAVPKPGNHNIVYTNCKGRFGVFDKRTGVERSYAVGAADMYGTNPRDLRYRFQRVSPVHVSPHNPDVVYHASQYVHRTTDDGLTWETISPDLTAFEADKQVVSGSPITRDITGEEVYSTIYALRESPVQAGVIWVGANDGPVHVTRDNGASWTDVTPSDLPPGGRVDAVEPSPHDPAKAYIAVLRYQLGDWHPYVYRTNDYGASWTLLSGPTSQLPQDNPTRVVREDPTRPGLLYLGTEFGMFLSFDDGQSWQSFQQNLPLVPITDIKCYRGDLVLSTMGRGFWIMDQVGLLHHPALAQLPAQPVLFPPAATTIRYRKPLVRDDSLLDSGTGGVFIDYYLPETAAAPLRLDILDVAGQVIQSFASDSTINQPELVENMALNQQFYLVDKALEAQAGGHRFEWDMTLRGPWDARANRRYKNGPLAAPGNYTVRLSVGDQVQEQAFSLVADPRLSQSGVTDADIRAQVALDQQVVTLLSEIRQTVAAWNKELRNLNARDRLSRSEAARRSALEKVLPEVQTEEAISYPQPMLIDQVAYLHNLLTGADQDPGRDARDRYTELAASWAKIKESIK